MPESPGMQSIAPKRGMALLFDCRPQSWTSREDQHLAVCRALQEKGVQPVIVFPEIATNRFTGAVTSAARSLRSAAFQERDRINPEFDSVKTMCRTPLMRAIHATGSK